MTIRLLPSNLVNQIAAGEVIERPAAALKELLENSIDAGAADIKITLDNGGKALIKVQDNGRGMARDDLPAAVRRHATSKLPGDDLVNLQFLGFRGEALPSIAAVARLGLTSRAEGSGCAYSIQVNGGAVGPVKPASLARGTEIEVRDMFYAVPARLKFLKTDAAELAACEEVVERLALVNPNIDFSLVADGRPRLNFAGSDNRAAAVIGRQYAKNAIHINATQDGMTLEGLVGSPDHGFATSAKQYMFVNGRCIKDRDLYSVLRIAYRNFMFGQRHPWAVLFITLPASMVDVNVHPAKTQVRFAKPQDVRSFIINAVQGALAKAPLKTAADAVQPQITENIEILRVAERKAPGNDIDNGIFEGFGNTAAPANQAANEIAQDWPLGTPKAQVLDTFIISETSQGIVIVDQHALHERLVYEKIKNRDIASQRLLIPEVVQCKPRQADVLIEHAELLAGLGFEIGKFGDDAISVHAINSEVSQSAVRQLMTDLLEDFGHGQAAHDKLAEKIARHACHRSIRSGRKLTNDEMHALLRQLESNPVAGHCIHGRPTFKIISRLELEKLFKR
ncbi:MAG: DNA mismatch repair endonuclease MutL [Alphaproteobacteria bacterium]|nr:DNA mismatch repair endonuclease MutL [Alphaproteobacteria bacterium]